MSNFKQKYLPSLEYSASMEEGIFNYIQFISIFISLAFFFISILMGYGLANMIVTLGCFITYGSIYWLSKVQGLYKYLTFPYVILSLLSSSAAWFVSDGLEGNMPFTYLIIFIVILMGLPQSQRKLASLLFLIDVLFLCYIDIFHSELFIPSIVSDQTTKYNLILTLVISILIVYILVNTVKGRYELEKKRVAEKNKELQKATFAKSQFLANMSHEIRTPMNGVIGMTSLLTNTPLNTEQQEYVETIQVSGDRLLNILNEILDFSKIEAGEILFEQSPFNLLQCIEEVLEISAPKALSKKLELIYLPDLNLPNDIVCDSGKIRQMLLNLVDNAIKFTEKGEIVIHAKVIEKLQDQQLLIEFGVSDTGIGISKKNQQKLFKEFSQVDASTTRKYGGTGLGLAIMKQLSVLMGGSAGVNSEEGKGSYFYFSIQTKVPDIPVAPLLPPKELFGLKALVVDDNASNRILLERLLKRWGMIVFMSNSAKEALHIIEQESLDLGIIDYHMPDIDGMTLGKSIRQKNIQFPLLMLSSGGRPKDKSFKEVFNIYSSKPIRQNHLKKTLLNLIQQKHSAVKLVPNSIELTSTLAEELPLRILIAEDDSINQKLVIKLFARLGYQPDIAFDGIQVLEYIKQKQYDIIFMDMHMPEMDGLEATINIKALSDNNEIVCPLIFAMTANALEEDKQKCFDVGMNDYISKPITINVIEALLLKWKDSYTSI